MLAIPNERSSHIYPTPTGAGISFLLVASPGLALLGNYLGLLCLPIALVGLWDDLYRLSAKKRIVIQIFNSLLLYWLLKTLLLHELS